MRETSKCKYCDADIIWLKTRAGKNICINPESYKGEPMFVFGVHIAHRATCPFFNKPKNAKVLSEYEANRAMFKCPEDGSQLLSNGEDIYCSRCGFIYGDVNK